jgi:hypothetical protein
VLHFVHLDHHHVGSKIECKVRSLHRAATLNGAIPSGTATLLKDVNATPLELTKYKVLLSNLALCEFWVEGRKATPAKGAFCISGKRCHSIHRMHTRNHATGPATMPFAKFGGTPCGCIAAILSTFMVSTVLCT